jgi:hypothetical protein
MPPPRNDAHNDMDPACPVCGTPFTRAGRRRYCTDACRQAAWRRCAGPPPGPLVPPARRPRRQGTIYQCTDCDTRYLASQWSPTATGPAAASAPGWQAAPSPSGPMKQSYT